MLNFKKISGALLFLCCSGALYAEQAKTPEALALKPVTLEVKNESCKLDGEKSDFITHIRYVTESAGDNRVEAAAKKINAGESLKAEIPANIEKVVVYINGTYNGAPMENVKACYPKKGLVTLQHAEINRGAKLDCKIYCPE